MRCTVLAVVSVTGACLAAPVSTRAVDLNKSSLTTVDLKKCRQISKHKDGGAWICPGIRGYPVYLAEGDLRQMLGFGPRPSKRKSATQTLGPFNTIFDGKNRATIEWRVEHDSRGRIVPFATIVRFHTSRDGEKSDVIVVNKVDVKESCQLAMVDARANSDAIAIARAWTISEARRTQCPDTPIVLGTPGVLSK